MTAGRVKPFRNTKTTILVVGEGPTEKAFLQYLKELYVDNASTSLRKLLLESCNLHTVLDLPGGTFTGAGVKTVVLFFEKGAPTRKVWFYQLNLDRNLGKTNPLNENDLADFVKLQKAKADSENSWSVDVADVDKETFDLSVKNPNKKNDTALREPKEILASMKKLDKESEEILDGISGLIHGQ